MNSHLDYWVTNVIQQLIWTLFADIDLISLCSTLWKKEKKCHARVQWCSFNATSHRNNLSSFLTVKKCAHVRTTIPKEIFVTIGSDFSAHNPKGARFKYPRLNQLSFCLFHIQTFSGEKLGPTSGKPFTWVMLLNLAWVIASPPQKKLD